MSLVFAGITPHPPLLIPTIGKGQEEKLAQTRQALETMEQELYLTKPQIIVIISPHGSLFPDAFSINAHTHICSDYELFGDLATKKEWTGTPDLAAKISHESKTHSIPTRLVSKEKVDHGVSVPLHFLTTHLPDVKILPVGFSGLDHEQHAAFADILKDEIMKTDKRVALLASADLAHTLSEQAPAGYHPQGEQFDKHVLALLSTKNTKGFSALDTTLVKVAQSCGYMSLLLFLQIMQEMDYEFKQLSYEAPFGVGYLTGQLVF